jgi:hypothetical protein
MPMTTRWMMAISMAAAIVLASSPATAASGKNGRGAATQRKTRKGVATPGRRAVVKPRTTSPNQLARTGRARVTSLRDTAPSARPRVRARPTSLRAHSSAAAPHPVSRSMGWGTFWATIGLASAATGNVPGAVVGASAAAYNFGKAYLLRRRGTGVTEARSIAFNAGWGTFWTGMGVHAIAAGDPFSAAIGLGAGAYNLIKATLNYGALPPTDR